MPHVHSHYENLRVARNAPREVIKAAYRVLAQQNHPDLREGDAESARAMAILNEAYRILSDPDLRKEHDAWIQEAESRAERRTDTPERRRSPVQDEAAKVSDSNEVKEPFRDRPDQTDSGVDLDREWGLFKRKLPHYLLNLGALLVLALVVWLAAR